VGLYKEGITMKHVQTKIADGGKVVMGGKAPALSAPKSQKRVADAGKVAMGGHAPSLPKVRVAPKSTADAGKVAMGGKFRSL
jgi:hypothetical protein